MEIYDKLVLATPFQRMFEGKPLPMMRMNEINGENIVLPTKGKVTFVNFWSVTCAPCIVEIPN
jgi:hypothetical protein